MSLTSVVVDINSLRYCLVYCKFVVTITLEFLSLFFAALIGETKICKLPNVSSYIDSQSSNELFLKKLTPVFLTHIVIR